MSLAIFWIAAIPTITILLVAGSTGSRLWTVFAVVGISALGALTGNPVYAAIDVGAALLVGAFCWVAVLPQQPRKGADQLLLDRAARDARKKTVDEFLIVICIFAVLAYFWYSKSTASDNIVTLPVTHPLSAPEFPRCSGNPDIYKCIEFEKRLAGESEAAKSGRRHALELSRQDSLAKVNSFAENRPQKSTLSATDGRPERAKVNSVQSSHFKTAETRLEGSIKPGECAYKSVMSDDDYIACGIRPPDPGRLGSTFLQTLPSMDTPVRQDNSPKEPPACRWISPQELSCH